MLYLSVKYELLPIKGTHFTIRREIQNVNFFQATLIFAWRQNFDYEILFHSYSTTFTPSQLLVQSLRKSKS